ncbi:hypothetical protein LTR16_004451 [Cryomyces antarcticus]|uniref:DUF7721 domain-containing protein n=1 Tax=Cryomyces antarcticus TaxID=329879 RepID=A0ABR0LN84_9PEZI|nr:hypothetical protein LTR39_006728 [Cryomyces antarcticus]KAK5200907.1 hypothetical protein LTR16_004451 [Cryomyces antarcticus]
MSSEYGGGRPGGDYEGGRQQGGYGHSTGTPYGGGGAYGGGSDDFSGAAHEAAQHAGSSGDSSLFSNALGMLQGGRHSQNEEIDEGEAVRQHQQMYGGQGGGQPASSNAMGGAAAMQALKMFTGGQGGAQGGGMGAGGQNQFVGMAMAQASKLFDQQSAQGNTHPSATKQDAVSSAAQMALKMYMKSQMGGGGGGASGLMGMASKFL